MASKPPPSLRLDGWPAGVNNRAAPFALPAGACRQAVNVDVRQSGKLVRRPGYTRLVSDAGAHSLHADAEVTLYVAQGQLKQLTGSTATVLDAGWGDAPTVYVRHGDAVFLSNGLRSAAWAAGALRPWGTPTPPQQPDLLALPTGGLAAGVYQVALTWSSQGIESGTPLAASVTVPEGGGIMLSEFPAPPAGVDTVSVYLSAADGTELYWDDDYPAYTTAVILEAGQRTVPLATQFMAAMPPVTRLASQGGRLYGAREQVVYCTSPFNPHLMESLDGLLFEAPITGLLPVTDGVYVATSTATWFMTPPDGDGPPARRGIAYHGGVPGTVVNDPLWPGGFWLGTRGLMRGLPSGQAENLTDANLALPQAAQGAAVVRETNGERHLVLSLWGCTNNPLMNTEWVAREIARKGQPF